MLLSENTMKALKNFATINKGLVINEPNVLKTMSLNGAVIGVYDCEEEFDVDTRPIGIYDLSNFIGAYSSLGNEVDLDLKEEVITLKSGKAKLNYRLSEAELIQNDAQHKPSENFKSFDKFNASFEMPDELLKKVLRVARSMNFNRLKITLEDGAGKLELVNAQNELANSFEYDIEGEGTGSVELLIDHLTFIEGNYIIHISDGLVVKFQNTEIPLFYFVSVVQK